MELTIKTHDRKLSASEEDLIRKKLNRLPRHLDDISDAELVVTQERRRGGDLQIVQLTLRAHGTLLRAEESDRDLPVALDATLSRMDRHIERYKGRYARRRKSHSDRDALPLVGDDGAAIEPDPEEPPSPPVRTKRFTVQPMVREEAIEQMELLGHAFYIYWDADDKQYAVLYRRHNGDYGVLEPELER